MDLHQCKLTKEEWEALEKPVSPEEAEILQLIHDGYQHVNIRYNKHLSLFGFLKIQKSRTLEDYLFNKYFSSKIKQFQEFVQQHSCLHGLLSCFDSVIIPNVTIKKVDSIRMQNNDVSQINSSIVFEFVLLEQMELLLHHLQESFQSSSTIIKDINASWQIQYFILYHLSKASVIHINRHILSIVQQMLSLWESDICEKHLPTLLHHGVTLLENKLISKYMDYTLYQHQKELFGLLKNPKKKRDEEESPPVPAKLILYIAPTGTGKTLSPLGICQEKRVIYVCAARHVGLAVAKSAISTRKKIAIAFGCETASEIRLHFFAAVDYTKDWGSGGIRKVNNERGEKVEMIICDIMSFIPSMNYMHSFNPDVNDIVVYWDEPTIAMDYETHPLHEIITKNWKQNIIPTMILSSATLPKVHELQQTIASFRSKFLDAEIHSIVSHDCKKSIPLINLQGYVVLPHILSDQYEIVMQSVTHCENNLTLLRYFDLQSVISFIELVNEWLQESWFEFHFLTLDDITMKSIKLHYLFCIKQIGAEKWPILYLLAKEKQKRFIPLNETIDPKGNKLRKTISLGPGIQPTPTPTTTFSNELNGKPLMRLASDSILPSTSTTASASASTSPSSQPGIYITTKDAFTLTDGPTIYLATDVEKIAKFYLQQANIPKKMMDDIEEVIHRNNHLNGKIAILVKDIADIQQGNMNKNDSKSMNGHGSAMKKSSVPLKMSKEDNGSKTLKLETELEYCRAAIRSCQLNQTFVPNKPLHIAKWSETLAGPTVFTSDITEETITDIMMLTDVQDHWKVLLMMGIGVFTNHPSIAYTEIMKKMAEEQKLFMIIASSDYIYGTNYQFCHGYLGKDLGKDLEGTHEKITQEKIIQAMGRIGRNNFQQSYSIRFRDEEQITRLFFHEENKMEVRMMNTLFC